MVAVTAGFCVGDASSAPLVVGANGPEKISSSVQAKQLDDLTSEI